MPPAKLIDDFEYPNHYLSLGVGSWKYNMAIHYQSKDEVLRSQVTELRWYKNLGSLEHEYVLATCRRVGEEAVYLRLERRPADPDFSPEQALLHEETEKFTAEERSQLHADIATERKNISRSVKNTAQKSAPKSKDDLLSDDSVTRVDRPKGSSGEQVRLMASYQDFGQPFYLRNLAFLALAINEHKPKYQVFVYQCYWFARTLVNTSVALYQPANIVYTDNFKAAGKYTVKTRTIVVNRNSETEVGEIKNKFDESVQVHDVKLQTKCDTSPEELQKKVAAQEERIRNLEAQLRLAGRSATN